jgi:hypothetical protein
MSCAICLEDDISETIACSQCSVGVCANCFEQFLLTKDLIPTCHSCNHPWSDDFVDEVISPTFRNGRLRDHKTKILLDQEVARMPELQDRARRYMMAIKGKRFLMNDIRISIIRSTGAPIGVRWIRDDRVQDTDQYFGDSSWRSDSVAEAPKPVKVLRACPGAGCRGFLNEIGTCALCTLTVCLKCMEQKEDEHACNPETVATVALLVRDTKPCPTCHAPISKIDGCDQMWCTQCQTAFSWRTGQKEVGNVHNPHFYEWMRRTQGSVPRPPGDERPDGNCGRLQSVRWRFSGTNYLDNAPKEKEEYIKKAFENIHRRLSEAHEYNPVAVPIQDDLNRLGVKYMAKELTQKEWARRVYLLKRQQVRQTAIHEIKAAFYNAGRDIFNAWVTHAIVTKDALKQLMELQLFMEAALKRSYKRFFYSSRDTFLAYDWLSLMPEYTHISKIGMMLDDEEFDPIRYKMVPELYEKYVNNLLA